MDEFRRRQGSLNSPQWRIVAHGCTEFLHYVQTGHLVSVGRVLSPKVHEPSQKLGSFEQNDQTPDLAAFLSSPNISTSLNKTIDQPITQHLERAGPINYKTTADWQTTVQLLTEGNGVDVVVETVGGQNLSRSLDVLRMGGHISIVGLLDGFDTSINTLTLQHRQATIKGMEVGGTQDFEAMKRLI
jgi:hypothetical protein